MASDRQLVRAHDKGNAGAINLSGAEIVFGAAAKRVLIDTLPAGALILPIVSLVHLIEAFNAGTSNLLTVGWGDIAAATADDIIATVTEGTPGVYQGVAALAPLAAETPIYAYYTPGAADATTGIARVYVAWARLAENA